MRLKKKSSNTYISIYTNIQKVKKNRRKDSQIGNRFACGPYASLLTGPIAHPPSPPLPPTLINLSARTGGKRVDRKMEAAGSPPTRPTISKCATALVPRRYLLEIITRAVVKTAGTLPGRYLARPTFIQGVPASLLKF